MTPFLWFIAGFLILAAIVLIVLTFVPAYRAASVRMMARTVGLALPAGPLDSLEANFASRSRASAFGALVGAVLVVTALVTGFIPTQDPPTLGGAAEIWLLIGGWYVGMGVGAAVRALSARTPAPVGERYARPGAVDMRDYLAPIDLVGGRIAVAAGVVVLTLATVVAVTGLGVAPTSVIFSIGGIVVLLSVASLVVFEIAARRILDRAQPAASPEALAWDDAIRAMTVREIVTAPLSLGIWGSLAIGILLMDSFREGNAWPAGLIAVTALVVIIAAGILGAATYSIATRPQQHYLRRLWPDVAAAETRNAERAETAAADAGNAR